MKDLQNIYFSFLYDLKRNYWLLKGRSAKVDGIVLMFHHITDDYVNTIESCQCKISLFEDILLSFQKRGYEFLSIEKALEKNTYEQSSKFVVVTFDDIPDNVFNNAYPILKKHKIPFAVFIAVDYIGRTGYITKDHLLELNKDKLCTIGAHTMTHPMLRNVQNYKWEIEQSKIELETVIGRKIKYFAYPYGRYSSVSGKIRKIVETAGFECAFSTVRAPLNEVSVKDRFFLPRVVPNVGDVSSYPIKWSFIDTTIYALSSIYKKILKRN